jgi:hypothetical protein
MFGNMGGLVSTWSFLDDGPDFPIGHGLNLASASCILIVATVSYFWMNWDNKRRDRINAEEALAGLSAKEIENLDWKHPGHRWRL